MANETMIPALPCRSINETVEFYVAMGFEVTYQQTRPNAYACVKRDGIDLHFFTMKGYDPAQSYSTCIVLSPDVDGLYQALAAGLRKHYGKLPVAGIPRINKPNNNNVSGERRFNIIDPGGNWIRISGKSDTPKSDGDSAPQSKLARTYETAVVLSDSAGNPAQAAKILDIALAHNEDVPNTLRVQVYVLRAQAALALDDHARAGKLLDEIEVITLTDAEREELADELQRAADLKQSLA